ncbi:MAG: hypothetical protein ACLU48_01990 [Clostridiaceae bacterium]
MDNTFGQKAGFEVYQKKSLLSGKLLAKHLNIVSPQGEFGTLQV